MSPAAGRGRPPLSVPAVAVAIVCLAAASGFAQMGHPPGGGVPGPPSAIPAPAVVDTAIAVLDFSEGAPAPVGLHAVQDSVVFGDVFHLVLDFPEAPAAPADIPLAAGGEWLAPEAAPKPGFWDRLVGRGSPRIPDVGDLPAVADGARVVLSFRVYRTDPFLVRAGDLASGVIRVVGRVEGTADTAPIRAPRTVPWSPWVILALLAFLGLVLFVGRLLWKRRRESEGLRDREIPAPAWLAAAIELRDLLAEGFLNRGDCRPFLDRLAGITRRYVAGRYRIAAQDMTGGEIIAACNGLGYLSPHPGVFGRLIDALDRSRYNPEAAAPGWCRDQAILFFEEIGRVRVVPRYTEVTAGLLVESEIAWKDLARELAAGSGRAASAHPVGSGGGA